MKHHFLVAACQAVLCGVLCMIPIAQIFAQVNQSSNDLVFRQDSSSHGSSANGVSNGPLTLDEVVVTARVQQTTTNHETLSKSELNDANTGQNLPYLLSQTPALQVTSDDGLGIGYTYFRIRGTDQARINMTINDVPLNDQESQTVFWVNMTDMASSMSSIDVQRGVGTSTNGSASFGASINMHTLDKDTVSHFLISFNGGMYNTFREMAQAHIVMPNNRWQINARFSKVNSDGFLYRTSSDLYSYHGDIGYYGTRTRVVATVFGGSEHTGMGWNGVSYDVAYGIGGADRRYNPAGEYIDRNGNICYYDKQKDHYAQQHAQLNINHRFSSQWSLDATLHYTHGAGYYDQMGYKNASKFGLNTTFNLPDGKANTVYKQYLDNHFGGIVASAKYVSEALDVQFGGAANYYFGKHYGQIAYREDSVYSAVLPVDYEYYRSEGRKADANVYAKVNWRIIHRAQEKLSLYADMQYRFVRYTMDGINNEDMKYLYLRNDYHFFNPKAGLTYQNHGHTLYASFAIANREPSRANFKENVMYDPTTGTYSGTMPQSERLYDYELGYTYSHHIFTVGANIYFMDYDNQLVLTGDYNDVGAMRTQNVKNSYRVGAEITAGVQCLPWLRIDANCVVSRNKIVNYDQYIDIYDENYKWADYETLHFNEATIAFSPTVTAMGLITFDVAGFTGTWQTNVTSKQYLDNTMNESASLKAFTVTNVHLQYELPLQKWVNKNTAYVPHIRLLCQINNLFNAKYASNGGADASYIKHTDGSYTHPWPWYYAQAGINVHAGFVVQW